MIINEVEENGVFVWNIRTTVHVLTVPFIANDLTRILLWSPCLRKIFKVFKGHNNELTARINQCFRYLIRVNFLICISDILHLYRPTVFWYGSEPVHHDFILDVLGRVSSESHLAALTPIEVHWNAHHFLLNQPCILHLSNEIVIIRLQCQVPISFKCHDVINYIVYLEEMHILNAVYIVYARWVNYSKAICHYSLWLEVVLVRILLL
jgi:hypothetical protein